MAENDTPTTNGLPAAPVGAAQGGGQQSAMELWMRMWSEQVVGTLRRLEKAQLACRTEDREEHKELETQLKELKKAVEAKKDEVDKRLSEDAVEMTRLDGEIRHKAGWTGLAGGMVPAAILLLIWWVKDLWT